MIKKIIKIFFIGLASLLVILVVLIVMLVIPQDRELDRTTLLSHMEQRIDSLPVPEHRAHSFTVGYAVENITPSSLTATAGYGNRLGRKVNSIHDSIYVRCMVIANGSAKVAIVSADLLMMPPDVARILEEELPSIGFSADNTYFGATHTHSSIGNWGHGLMTVMYGDYDKEVVQCIKDKILAAIRAADASKVAARISAAQIPVSDAVRNRINKGNPVDSLLRVIRVERADSAKLLLLNFTAHATCISDNNLILSADYPGLLTAALEDKGYAFAMFMAGAVGSHAAKTKDREWPCVEELANKLATSVTETAVAFKPVTDSTLWMGRVKLAMNEAQFKVSKEWRLRPWAFNELLGDYPEYLSGLRIGDLFMMGTPCDFSGEFYPALDAKAAASGLRLMITSFNGGYIGYVTPEKYYDMNHYETQLMNWYGPGTGEYLMGCMEMLMEHAVGGGDGVDLHSAKK